MILARVIGTLTSTDKDAQLVDYKLMVVQPLDLDDAPDGEELIAVDQVDAGIGEKVLIVKGGEFERLKACYHPDLFSVRANDAKLRGRDLVVAPDALGRWSSDAINPLKLKQYGRGSRLHRQASRRGFPVPSTRGPCRCACARPTSWTLTRGRPRPAGTGPAARCVRGF